MSTLGSSRRVALPFRIHWHVVLTHFPLSFFGLSFAFMALHLFTETACFEMSGYLSLVVGAAMMAPTGVSGWLTWKDRYTGAMTPLFLRKIQIAFAMTALSVALVIWRAVLLYAYAPHTVWHYSYAVGTTLLILGAVVEGYHGGRLNHR